MLQPHVIAGATIRHDWGRRVQHLRTVDLDRPELADPPEAWEAPGAEDDLRVYQSLRRAAYPMLPDTFEHDLPEGSIAALERAVGSLRPGDVVLVPRTPRPVPGGGWVATPTSVLGIGPDGVALWVGEEARRVVARIPRAEVAAVLDLTVLLYGRLEIVGPAESIVLRYNTVGRQEIRTITLAIRRAFAAAGDVELAGPPPPPLPHKWTALLRSPDTAPHGDVRRYVVTGDLDGSKRRERNGFASMTAHELLLAIEPQPLPGTGAYGVNLVSLPRANLARIAAGTNGDRLEIDLATGHGGVHLLAGAHPTLVAAAASAFGRVRLPSPPLRPIIV